MAGFADSPELRRQFYPKPSFFLANGLPNIIMGYVFGKKLGMASLNRAQLAAIADAKKQLFAITPQTTSVKVGPANTDAAGMLEFVEKAFENMPDLPEPRQIVRSGWTRLRGSDPAIIKTPATRVFSHGDGNLENYLWHEGEVRLIDFEYSGWSDRVYDLADFVEHPQSRQTPLTE